MSYYLKKIVETFTQPTRECMDEAISVAVKHHHHQVEVEHLLLALMQCQSALWERLSLVANLHVDIVLAALKTSIRTLCSTHRGSPLLSAELVMYLEQASLHASVCWQQQKLTPAALLGCVLTKIPDNNLALSDTLLQALSCNTAAADTLLRGVNQQQDVSLDDTQYSSGSTDTNSAVQKYTRNLTALARQGELDPTPGRETEIRQIIDILLRRRQNNPVLTGDAGVGKTALVEGLAQRIVAKTVPGALITTELLTLDLGLLQAGASVKGEFENRLQTLLREINALPMPVILFIDEAHTLIGSGGQSGQNDAANLLKPALARGQLRVIAATTWAEYKKYFEKDAALARRFEVVQVLEPDTDTATAMLRSLAPAMALHHGVQIQESAIHAAVKLAQRYITGRLLPDKSVSLLDTACARVSVSQSFQPKEIEDCYAQLQVLSEECSGLLREGEGEHRMRLQWINQQQQEIQHQLDTLALLWQQQSALVVKIASSSDEAQKTQWRAELSHSQQQQPLVFERVDDVCVADIVASWTGIPLGRMVHHQPHQLDALVAHLEQRVVGQSHALKEIASCICIAHANLHDPQKPCGVFMLAGPSGVGKTETALALADMIYGGEQSLITINMSEFQEAHSVSGLKGSPPGYVGYGEGGRLTEAVRRRPYSVVLLDEVEKAHPDVMEMFYSVFDKGVMEDAEGQQINFRNTFIIMTSNLAAEKLMQSTSVCGVEIETLTQLIRPEFDRVFRPALMGRVSLIPYLPVAGDILARIIRLKLGHLIDRFIEAGLGLYSLNYQPDVVDYVATRCLVAQSGARDIDTILGHEVLPVLAEGLLTDKFKPGRLTLVLSSGELVLTCSCTN
ncbi:TPA: type VI secretion system ATPase TssH [Yersinia enterocolitica]